MNGSPHRKPEAAEIGQIIREVHLPLSNIEYTIEQYLLSHGQRLDAETRLLLAGVRDCVGRVATSMRQLSLPVEALDGIDCAA